MADVSSLTLNNGVELPAPGLGGVPAARLRQERPQRGDKIDLLILHPPFAQRDVDVFGT